MPWFLTQYPPIPTQPNSDGETVIGYFGTHIWARHMEEAKAFALARNIGEIIIGRSYTSPKSRPHPLPSEMLRKRRLTPRQRIEVLHAVSFLAYLCVQSLGTPAHETVGDEGFVHETIHSLLSGTPQRAQMIATLEHYENRVPGYRPTRRAGV
jgi:hypothetical protein